MRYSLTLNWDGWHGINIDENELNEAIAAIPADTTTLDVCEMNLGQNLGVLRRILIALPPSVRTLNLCQLELDDHAATLARTLSLIPVTVETLKLSGNYLFRLRLGLAEVIGALPHGIRTLDLSGINDQRNIDEWISLPGILKAVFNALPPSIASLDLSDNNLGDESERSVEMAETLALIPPSLEKLNLSHNHLNRRPLYSLVAILGALRTSSLQVLHLRGLNLEECWDEKDESINADEHLNAVLFDCHKIFPTINALNRWNQLEEIDVRGYEITQMTQLMAGLPHQLMRLSLEVSDWTDKSNTELTAVFSGFPLSLNTLELMYVDEAVDERELARLIGCTPSSVNTIVVEDELFNSVEKMVKFILSLPRHIEAIGSSKGAITRTEDYLLSQVLPLASRDNGVFIATDTTAIRPTFLMNQRTLEHVIAYFVQHPSALNQLACGMLLEGRIETSSTMGHEIDLLRAIDFYRVAGQLDAAIQSVADYFLWFRQVISPPPSSMMRAQEKLNELSVVPSGLIATYGLFSHPVQLSQNPSPMPPIPPTFCRSEPPSRRNLIALNSRRPLYQITPEMLNHIVASGPFQGYSVALAILLSDHSELLCVDEERLARAITPECLNHIVRNGADNGLSVALLLAANPRTRYLLAEDDYRLAKAITPECFHTNALMEPFGSMQSVASSLVGERYSSRHILDAILAQHAALPLSRTKRTVSSLYAAAETDDDAAQAHNRPHY